MYKKNSRNKFPWAFLRETTRDQTSTIQEMTRETIVNGLRMGIDPFHWRTKTENDGDYI